VALTITNPRFSGPEFRTSKKASYIGSTTGFMTKGATVEDDYFLRTPFQTLTMIHPRPPTSLTFTSVWNKWVTNAPYKVYPSARGGCYPYIWSLVGAPSGMTISSTLTDNSTYANRAAHGRITWATPVAGDYTFTVVCVDQMGTRVSETVTLNVNDSNAIWMDSATGTDSTGAAGTKAAPFAKIDNWYADVGGTLDPADTRFTGKILICRAGTYTIPRSPGQLVMQYGSNKPTTIVAYNDESVIWDCSNSSLLGSATAGTIRLEMIGMTFSGENEVDQDNTQQVHVTSDHLIICDHLIKDFKNGGDVDPPGVAGPGGDNPGGIRNSDGGYQYYNQLRNIRITGLSGGTNMTSNACAIVMFGLREYELNNIECLGIDGAIFCIVHQKHDHQYGVTRHLYIVYDKDTVQQYTGCFAINDVSDLGGNEFEFNYLQMLNTPDPCFCIGSNNVLISINTLAMRRNTVNGGTVRLTNCTVAGDFTRGANVIQNAEGAATGMTEHAVWSGHIISESNSVTATSGLLDSSGLLTGSTRTSYLNKKGWEISV